MKSIHSKIITVLVLVICIIFFLCSSFSLLISGFVRDHNAIEISDNNKDKIISLLEENINCYEEIPNIRQAVKMEYIVLMHKDEITVHYDDETTYNFFIKDAYQNPVTLYIKNEGYNVYFNSSKFIFALIKIVFSFLLSVASTVVLLKLRKVNSN